MSDAPLAPTRSRKAQTYKKEAAVWSPEEDTLLTQVVSSTPGPVKWINLVPLFQNKTAPQISNRWMKVLNPNLIKGSWTREEDEVIIEYVNKHGASNWSTLAELLPGRIGKQCRERWTNHLNPCVSRRVWTPEEDQKLVELRSFYGNAWSKISQFFIGRTDNCLKNRWNSTLKRRMERMENGEPLMKKRGRKTKISSSSELSQSHSIIEFFPLTKFTLYHTSKLCIENHDRAIPSLETNRNDLYRLIDSII